MKMMVRIYELQRRLAEFLPESIRENAEDIEYSLTGMHDNLPKLNDVQMLAGEVILWTVEMFEMFEGDEE